MSNNIYIGHNIGIQIKQEELTKTFMLISNLKTVLSLVFTIIFQRFNLIAK